MTNPNQIPAGRDRGPIVTAPLVVAVVLLSTAAILAGPVASRMQFKLAKTELPLKRPLSALDASELSPYRVTERHVLESVVVSALGTDRYLLWQVEDISVPASDPLRHGLLFVTYYSGGRNLVPHTPDVCYLGAGYAPSRPHENIVVPMPSLPGGELPMRVLSFARTAVFDRDEKSVVYTFHCNGRFVDSGAFLDPRTGVRVLINDPRNTYAYFSKVEVSFPRANREQTIEGARKLFGVVLPMLTRDHWPDFQAAEEAARQADGA